ncbi:hypothetical protein RHSIM_RhsimUnG0080100 [Rhododendron simsii]|uniref:Uncharacterized protein n=1 Tax=Rhododendron simsii TaxID=118357 RepID=A0A834FVT3_RHOSS|nr:hypothetical protein RHSIM_RhsimUnG0080100 [Rhododendron simsii]
MAVCTLPLVATETSTLINHPAATLALLVALKTLGLILTRPPPSVFPPNFFAPKPTSLTFRHPRAFSKFAATLTLSLRRPPEPKPRFSATTSSSPPPLILFPAKDVPLYVPYHSHPAHRVNLDHRNRTSPPSLFPLPSGGRAPKSTFTLAAGGYHAPRGANGHEVTRDILQSCGD